MSFHDEKKEEKKQAGDEPLLIHVKIPETAEVKFLFSDEHKKIKHHDFPLVSQWMKLQSSDDLRVRTNPFSKQLEVMDFKQNPANIFLMEDPQCLALATSTDTPVALITVDKKKLYEWALVKNSLEIVRESKIDCGYGRIIKEIKELPGDQKEKGRYVAITDSNVAHDRLASENELYLFDTHAQKQFTLTIPIEYRNFYILNKNIIGIPINGGLVLFEIHFDAKKGLSIELNKQQQTITIPNMHHFESMRFTSEYWLFASSRHPSKLFQVNYAKGHFNLKTVENIPSLVHIDKACVVDNKYFLCYDKSSSQIKLIIPSNKLVLALDIKTSDSTEVIMNTNSFRILVAETNSMKIYDFPDPLLFLALDRAFLDIKKVTKQGMPPGVLDLITGYAQAEPESAHKYFVASRASLFARNTIQPLDHQITPSLIHTMNVYMGYINAVIDRGVKFVQYTDDGGYSPIYHDSIDVAPNEFFNLILTFDKASKIDLKETGSLVLFRTAFTSFLLECSEEFKKDNKSTLPAIITRALADKSFDSIREIATKCIMQATKYGNSLEKDRSDKIHRR